MAIKLQIYRITIDISNNFDYFDIPKWPIITYLKNK